MGCTFPVGFEPAEKPINLPWLNVVVKASAKMLRAELPVQRNKTLKIFKFIKI